MSTGTIIDALGWVAAVLLAEVSLSSAYRIASVRVRRLAPGGPLAVPDYGWMLPGISAGTALAVVTFLGAVPPWAGILGSALALGAAVRPIAFALVRAARQGNFLKEARRIVSVLAGLAWTARAFLAEDLRALARRRTPAGVPAPGGVPVRPAPGVPPWRRTVPGVPSIQNDPALGAIPAPSEVSAALAASGVTVPPAWAAVAAETSDHEPESDEEHCEHMDGEVAGVLTWAEAAMSRAETLGDAAGLDPAYIAAQYELADAIAELAAFAAQVQRRYHDTYDDIREAAEGKPLPANRYWFGDGGTPQGGRAA